MVGWLVAYGSNGTTIVRDCANERHQHHHRNPTGIAISLFNHNPELESTKFGPKHIYAYTLWHIRSTTFSENDTK
ncbi:hypothetical protein BLOT_010323 [Blomia tropicalis]|nr:hypothetical protein BLOT_010323 [Blomia tropicalis]